MPDAAAGGERVSVEVIGADDRAPGGRRRFGVVLVVVVGIALVAVAVAVVVAGHRARQRAVVPDEAFLVTGSGFGVEVQGAGPDRIVFSVENLGHYPVSVEPPRIEAAGVSTVSVLGAGRVEPGQSATLTFVLYLRCGQDPNAQRAAATVVIPYRSAAGRRHEIRETPTTVTTGPGQALGNVLAGGCG